MKGVRRILPHQLPQNRDRLPLPAAAILAAGANAGGAAIVAAAFADQLQGAGEQGLLHFEEFLAEADPCRDLVVEHDGGQPLSGRPGWVGEDA